MSDRRGMALILTLWILAALIVLAAGMGVMARSEAQISRNYADVVRCRWAASAGVNSAMARIEQLADQPDALREQQGVPITSEDEGLDLGEAFFETTLEDEAGKININTASVEVLEALFGSRDIAECIVDWRDEDDLAQPMGAETQYYSGLQTPHRAKNGPFDTVRELLLVKGIDEEMLSTPITEDGSSLLDMVTVYSTDSNLTADGQDRLNINKASQQELKSSLGDVLTDQDIAAVIKQRGQGQFQSAAEIIRVQGLGRDKVQRIFDRITVSDDESRPGLVNINTAPAEVLAAIPGLEGIAEEIVAYRESSGAFGDVGGLLAVSGVTDRAFERSADLLTTRSKVFRIESTGRFGRQQAEKTITCVVDSSGETAQTKYWQE